MGCQCHRLVFVRGRPVGARQDARRPQRLQGASGRVRVIRARVGYDPRPQGEQRAVRRGGDLRGRALLTRLGRRAEILAALLDPFHRTAEPARERGYGDVLGKDLHLEPEAAAHVRRDDPYARLREIEGHRQGRPHDRRALTR